MMSIRIKCLAFIVLALSLISCAGTSNPDEEDRGSYSIYRVKIGAIPAFLLVPERVDAEHPGPAVLMLHDHGARFDIGKEKLARPLKSAPENIKRSARQWVDKNFEGVFLADSLASLGYIVLVPDALYCGERSSADAQRWSCLTFLEDYEKDLPNRADTIKVLKDVVYEGQRDVYATCRSNLGLEWAEVILQDDLVALTWLYGLDIVDKERIGAFGFSMGAHRTWFLASHTGILRCAVAQNWMTSLAAADVTSASSLSMSVSYLRKEKDIPEIAAMASPTPMLMLAGERDHLFPRDTVARCFEVMQNLYEPNMLRTEFFDGEHECPKRVQARIVSYLDEMLK